MKATWLPSGMAPLLAKGLPPAVGLMPVLPGVDMVQPVIGPLPAWVL